MIEPVETSELDASVAKVAAWLEEFGWDEYDEDVE